LKKNLLNSQAAVLICFLLLSCLNREAAFPQAEETEEVVVVIDPLKIRAEEIVAALDDRCLAAQVLICAAKGKGTLTP
jgi:hypothetical protein